MSTLAPNFAPSVVKGVIEWETSSPRLAHYAHPGDPSGRSARCGKIILGIDAFEPFTLCPVCAYCYRHKIGAVRNEHGDESGQRCGPRMPHMDISARVRAHRARQATSTSSCTRSVLMAIAAAEPSPAAVIT